MSQETKLIDYLYGEMTPIEKQLFEEELANNPELQKELSALQGSRDFLADLSDVTPSVKVVALKPKPRRWLQWLVPVGIAASLLLLFKMVDFQSDTTEMPNYITVTEVQQLLESQKIAHQKELLLMDSIWQNRMVQQEQTMQKNIQRQLVTYQTGQKAELKAFATTFRQQEIPELASQLQNLQAQQQQELRLLLGQFWTDWQVARTEDLDNIKQEFTNVYQNQSETDAVLVNMIATSGEE